MKFSHEVTFTDNVADNLHYMFTSLLSQTQTFHLHESSNVASREHWGSSIIRIGCLSQPQLGAGLIPIDIGLG